jgi:hypothetical protein
MKPPKKPRGPTQEWRREQCRLLIDAQPFHRQFPAEVAVKLSDLCRFTEFHNAPLHAVKRIPNTEYPSDTRHLYARETEADEWLPFSWNRWIKGGESERIWLRKALRDEIQADADDFLSAIEPRVCANPRNRPQCTGTQDLTADHSPECGGMAMSAIIDEFCRVYPVIPVVRRPLGGGGMLEDREQAAMWIMFHSERVCWRVLCRSCNAANGNRGDGTEDPLASIAGLCFDNDTSI